MLENQTRGSHSRPTWCEIDIEAIEHNIRQVVELLGPQVRLLVCLKGDAFGCGAVEVARACERMGAYGLTFGNIDSAIVCREAGVTLPMLLYPTCLPAAAPLLSGHGMSITVSTREEVEQWARYAEGRLDVFLKIDTGGFRAGAFPNDAVEVASAIAARPTLHLAGVYGHSLATYLNGMAPQFDGSSQQVSCFVEAVDAIEAAGIDVPLRMCSSSEILLTHPRADLNAVDPGRLISGLPFDAIPSRRRTWRPGLRSLKSRLVMVKRIDSHGDVPVTPFFPVHEGMTIGLIPYGWSDGCPRELSPDAYALVRGQRAPLLAPVHSELLRVDLTGIVGACIGDVVTLMGADGATQIDLETFAHHWGQPLLDVYCTVGKGVPRVYVRSPYAAVTSQQQESA